MYQNGSEAKHLHLVSWKHFNLIHHIFRCMQMNSGDEAGVGPKNFNT